MIVSRSAIISLFEGCRSMRELKQLHAHITVTALFRDVVPVSRLIDFCVDTAAGDLLYAHSVFLRLDHPSVFIWNSMIRGFCFSQEPDGALDFFRDMHHLGYTPDNFTFPFVLKSCGLVSDLGFGESVHCHVCRTGYESDLYVSTSLVHMYACCGSVDSARLLFEKMPNRNVVGWTSLIAGYVINGRPSEAIRVFKVMGLAGIKPNEVTMVHALSACAQARDLQTGRWIHGQVCRIGTESIVSNLILATAIIDMYARCGSLRTARHLFDLMPQRNEVSWNAMMSGYNQYGRSEEVIELFVLMSTAGIRPDKVTLLSLLGACARRFARGLGQGIHAYIEKTDRTRDLAVSTCLIDMYAKMGDTQSALKIFGYLQRRDVLTWTSMIMGVAMHGNGEEAIDLFIQMERDGVVPDHITFIGVMSACSHSGLIDEGRQYFSSMRRIYGITPSLEHYGCMVDLLSRAGHLDEAERVVQSMPVCPNLAIWGSILSGCEIHGNVDLAERVGSQIADLNPQDSGVYVLLSNIYAGAGRWEGVERAREAMRRQGIEKNHGYSSCILSENLPVTPTSGALNRPKQVLLLGKT